MWALFLLLSAGIPLFLKIRNESTEARTILAIIWLASWFSYAVWFQSATEFVSTSATVVGALFAIGGATFAGWRFEAKTLWLFPIAFAAIWIAPSIGPELLLLFTTALMPYAALYVLPQDWATRGLVGAPMAAFLLLGGAAFLDLPEPETNRHLLYNVDGSPVDDDDGPVAQPYIGLTMQANGSFELTMPIATWNDTMHPAFEAMGFTPYNETHATITGSDFLYTSVDLLEDAPPLTPFAGAMVNPAGVTMYMFGWGYDGDCEWQLEYQNHELNQLEGLFATTCP